jgi:hypothetical protein
MLQGANKNKDIVVENSNRHQRALWLIFGCFAIGIGTGMGILSSKYGSKSEKTHSGLIGFLAFYFFVMVAVFIYSVKRTSSKCTINQWNISVVNEDLTSDNVMDIESIKVQRIVELVKLRSNLEETHSGE